MVASHQPLFEKWMTSGGGLSSWWCWRFCRGVDRMYAARGNNIYGVGSYFGADMSLVDRYTCQVYSAVDNQVCHAVFMNKVLVGEYVQGSKDMCKSCGGSWRS